MRIVFCLPGNSFSGRFLECWTDLFVWCLRNGIQPILSRRESCNIYYVRNMCLGADVMRGEHQKPFNGTLQYDFIMWIDSDIIFTPEHFVKLLNHNKDIVSGIYLMSDRKHFATVMEWDEEYFIKNGGFKFLTQEDLTPPRSTPRPSPRGEGDESAAADESGEVCLLPISYTGMGFMLVKYGVFESMEYSWSKPLEKRIGNAIGFTMEDVSFCLRAQEKGYKIYIDPTVRVGHEKKEVI